MARPTAFDRQTSFAQFSSQFPAKPQNGASLDAEFNAVKVAIDETQSNLALIQDDDGRLARGSVGRAQFDASITLGFENPTPWLAGATYTADLSTVWFAGKFYTCVESHTSGGAFDATKWFEIADLSVSAAIEDGSITDEKLAPSSVTADKIGPLAVTTPKIAAQAVTNSKLANNAVTLSKLDAALPAQLRDLIIPAGLGPLPWSLAGAAPAGWIFDGGTYNRADFPTLAALAVADAANPTSWFTVGDGSTTFGIKSAEGCTTVGVDADGSTLGAAVTLGATVGAKNKTLDQTNLPLLDLSVNIPAGQGSHNHAVRVTGGTGTPAVITGNGQSGGEANRLAGAGGIALDPATLPAMSGTAATGGSNAPFSLVQPSIGVRFIFKAH